MGDKEKSSMGKKKMRKIRKGLLQVILAIILGISIPGAENLSWTVDVVSAASETEITTESETSEYVWKQKKGRQYCYKNGKKLTGFQKIEGNYYYFNSKGEMCTGWQFAKNHYRYFDYRTGKMRINTTVQGRKIDSDGIWTPVVVLDPGHSGVVAGGYEPLGPGSSQKKSRDTSGTEGITTGVEEYKLTLKVAKQLSAMLKEQGCKVVLTRTNSRSALSCAERAKIANKAKADAYLRIHANSFEVSSVTGAETLCVTRNNPYVSTKLYKKSYALSRSLLDAYVSAVGCVRRHVCETDELSGNNWSKVPTTLIELGFMSNPSEDRKMQTSTYQKKMVKGMANGIKAYFLGK